jgi:hypothetical protein
VPWGPDSLLHLVNDTRVSQASCGAGYFFDAACVNSPTNYVYPSTYETRALVTPNPTPETRNPKPETRNPKPENRNLKP